MFLDYTVFALGYPAIILAYFCANHAVGGLHFPKGKFVIRKVYWSIMDSGNAT